MTVKVGVICPGAMRLPWIENTADAGVVALPWNEKTAHAGQPACDPHLLSFEWADGANTRICCLLLRSNNPRRGEGTQARGNFP
ncbi:hypothetical protein [Arthrobacter livingstonensis]|uniref:hypothetical protein n=1 Tax=Arthrobacter livingstonensis TaxID=670078 RepID=UPI0011B437CB|nr:hypothetical protein [Arthrobacter livingstonensis]